MKKKIIAIIFVIVCIIIGSFVSNMRYGSHYEKAKGESVRFLNRNERKLEEICKTCIREDFEKEYEFKGRKYYYVSYNGKEYVVIEINERGMLGGQYWELIYCPDDYLDGESIKIYSEFEETGKGNNIIVTEKIRENWYFCYKDYDGKVDIDKIR